jgi:hypothetical protein
MTSFSAFEAQENMIFHDQQFGIELDEQAQIVKVGSP